MKRGFTLIELLVVVLIIGILAAIALPAYQTAMDKSRYSRLMPIAKSIKDAQERVLMTHSAYAPDLAHLDVSLPTATSGNIVSLPDGEVYKIIIGSDLNSVRAENNDTLKNAYVLYLNQSDNFSGDIHCEALTTSQRAHRLCQSMGGVEIGINDKNTVYLLQGGGNGNFPIPPKVITGAKYKYPGYGEGSRVYEVTFDDGEKALVTHYNGEAWRIITPASGAEKDYYIYNTNDTFEVMTNYATGDEKTYMYDASGNPKPCNYKASCASADEYPPLSSWPPKSSWPSLDEVLNML